MSDYTSQQATFTHGHHETTLSAYEWRTVANSIAYVIPYLKPDFKILDVGSGPGSITMDLASKYVPQGHVTGLEYSAEAVERARDHAAASNVTNVTFLTGDVFALPFADATFDVTHEHQVLQHIADPHLALREMHRVTKPGGIVAARECDLSTFTWFPESPAISEWAALLHRVQRANGGETDAGRRVKMWARQAGFDTSKVVCSVGTWLFSTPEERAWYGNMWADRTVQSEFARGAMKQGATQEDLTRISEGWRKWTLEEDGWFCTTHGELIYRV